MNRYVYAVALVGLQVVGCTAGAITGYMFAKKKLATEYQEALETEVLATKKFYAIVNKVGVEPETISEKSPVEIPEEIKPVLDRYAGRNEKIQYHRPVEKAEVVTQNIFANVPDDPKPELITEAEFLENGPEYTQLTYTYYQGDGVVANQSDEVVRIVESELGVDWVDHFGEGDWDPNILYIMNRRLEHMFEINLSSGKYSVEVLGLEE